MTTGRTLMTDVRLFLLGRRAAAAVLVLAMETLLCYLGWDVAIDTYPLGQHVSLPLGTANVVPPLAAISVVAFCSPSNPDVDALAAPRLHRFDTVLVTVISACAASTAALMHLALTLTPDSLVPRIDRYCAYPGCLAESFSVQMLMGEWSIGLLYAALSIMATSLIGTLPGAAATGIAYAITVAVGSCPQIAVISPLTVVTAPDRAPWWMFLSVSAFVCAIAIHRHSQNLRPGVIRLATHMGVFPNCP